MRSATQTPVQFSVGEEVLVVLSGGSTGVKVPFGYSLFSSSTLLVSSLSLGLLVIAFFVVDTFLVVLLGGAEVVVLAGRLGCGLGFGLAVVLAVVVLRRVVIVVLGVVLAVVVVLRCVVLVVELVVLVILGVVEGGARTAVAFLPRRGRSK